MLATNGRASFLQICETICKTLTMTSVNDKKTCAKACKINETNAQIKRQKWVFMYTCETYEKIGTP